ncbi:MAG: hypothetical protein IKO52_10830 [Clostridia bacterium]|nr:hypothetical protein [Clostridia bacterium]
MKKLLALIISLTLVLSCLPGAAMAEKYKSNLLDKTIKLPSKLALLDEQLMDDGGVKLIIGVETQPDAAIYTTVQIVEGFDGYTMSTLPDEQLDAWTEYYYQYYPENASAGRLPSNSGNGDTLYMYCGQSADGASILVYASVKGSLFVSSYCVAAGGFSKATMQGTLEALNAVNAAFGKAVSGSTVYDYVFDHDDYDVVVAFLLLDDEDIDLYEDDDFDWDDDDWDEDDDDDEDDEDEDDGEDDDWDNDGEDDNDGDNDDDDGDWDSDDDAGDDNSGDEDGGDEDYSGDEDSGDEE